MNAVEREIDRIQVGQALERGKGVLQAGQAVGAHIEDEGVGEETQLVERYAVEVVW